MMSKRVKDNVNLICYRCKKKVKESYMLHDRIVRGKERELCLPCCYAICKHTVLGHDDNINLDSSRRAIITMECYECHGKIQGIVKVDKNLTVSPYGKELDL